MANIKYRIMFTGDDHLSSKNYGGHYDYPAESLHYFKMLTGLAKEYGATHWIGLGDFTYGRFGADLTYRKQVEDELAKQLELMHGNRWIIKGNHDKASSGMTEYEFYAGRLFRTSEDLELDNLIIHMKDYGDLSGINTSDGKVHVLATHGLFTFKNSNLPNFGASTLLDDKADWFGLPYIICGHIHEEHILQGHIGNGTNAYPTVVHYLPCLSRPAYHGDDTPTKGAISFIDVYDNSALDYKRQEIELLPLGQCFNIQKMTDEKEHSDHISIDLSDITKNLVERKISAGNPEDVIMAMDDINLKYRKKAVELLKNQ